METAEPVLPIDVVGDRPDTGVLMTSDCIRVMDFSSSSIPVTVTVGVPGSSPGIDPWRERTPLGGTSGIW